MIDEKLIAINAGTFVFTMSDIDVILKITLLVVTIGYTIHKWTLLNKKKK
jgi:hypothetical protein